MSLYFRTLWISDTHLGGKNLNSARLYDFLKNTESEYLYLVGDIFDLWKLSKKWHWPEINDHIVRLIISKAGNGTKVVYIPGNHDALFRKYANIFTGTISIQNETIHTSSNGSRFLVLHGDKFDCVIQNSRWLASVGSVLYDFLLDINRIYNTFRTARKKSYFSISASLKHRCKKAVNYIGKFEQALIKEVRKKQVDGIICGHIHHATVKMINEYLYANPGDWVESCTALAENANGAVGIIEWAENDFQLETSKVVNYEKDRYRDRCLAPTN